MSLSANMSSTVIASEARQSRAFLYISGPFGLPTQVIPKSAHMFMYEKFVGMMG
jgi:hypothetical protein